MPPPAKPRGHPAFLEPAEAKYGTEDNPGLMPLKPVARPLFWLSAILLLAWIPGTPGLGFETRTPPEGWWDDVLYSSAAALPILVMVLAWKAPRAAGPLGILAGAIAIVLPALDLAGLLQRERPPTIMLLDEFLLIGLGFATGVAAFRVIPRGSARR